MKTKVYCPFCGMIFESAVALKIHAKEYHQIHGNCPACKKQFRKLVEHFYHLAPQDKRHAILYYLYRNPHGGRSDISKHGKEIILKELSIKYDI